MSHNIRTFSKLDFSFLYYRLNYFSKVCPTLFCFISEHSVNNFVNNVDEFGVILGLEVELERSSLYY